MMHVRRASVPATATTPAARAIIAGYCRAVHNRPVHCLCAVAILFGGTVSHAEQESITP